MDSPARAAVLDRLRAAIEADPDPTHRVAHAATLELLDRRDRACEGHYPEGWLLFADAVDAIVGEAGWAITVGVLANMIGAIHFTEAADVLTCNRLTKRYGHRRIASVQSAIDGLLDTGPTMPVATRWVLTLALADDLVDLLEASGLARDEATRAVERCYQAGFWLVMADVDPDAPGPVLATPEEVADTWDHGGLPAWRAQVAIIAANPWTPYGAALKELAVAADRLVTVHAIDEAIKVYRARFERRERELVAREIRRLVAVSGLNQRDFAAMAGTSASRLSTYVNGLVTPSATMMVRIRRVSHFAQRRRAEGAP